MLRSDTGVTQNARAPRSDQLKIKERNNMAKNNKYDINNLNEVYELLQNETTTLYDKYSFAKNGKTYNLTLGKIWFNLLLPDEHPIVTDTIDKTKLYTIIDDMYEKYPPEKLAEIISNLNREAFKMTSINPSSFSIDDVILPKDIKEEKDKELTKETPVEEYSSKLAALSKKYVDNMNDESGIKDILRSGARGNDFDYGVLQISKGPVMTLESTITESITSSLNEGYSPEEYFDAASGARRAYFIRSRGTAEPGTLARGTTYANSNLKINKEDCNTKKYFNLQVTSKNAKTLHGRYYLNEKTNKVELLKDPEKFIGKTIQLRSPLYCKDKKGICKTCYGQLGEKLNTKYVGLIAGEVVNDAGQAFTMSQRHKSTNVSIKEVDFTKDILTF
jgi:DNA-directed RNA polymerase subunit beta'